MPTAPRQIKPRRDLEIWHGDDYRHRVTFAIRNTLDPDVLDPINLTGRTYRAHIRADKTSLTPDAQFAIDMTQAAVGVIYLDLNELETGGLDPAVTYFWDLEEQNGARTTTLMYGEIDVVQDSTH